MEFNFNNESPIYIQLIETLMLAIVKEEYPIGSKLPSVRDLAFTAKVNPNTMQKALTELEEKGLIYTERTNGKYVTNDKELIKETKDKLAKEIVNKYINSMNSIGFTKEESLFYLQTIGGK